MKIRGKLTLWGLITLMRCILSLNSAGCAVQVTTQLAPTRSSFTQVHYNIIKIIGSVLAQVEQLDGLGVNTRTIAQLNTTGTGTVAQLKLTATASPESALLLNSPPAYSEQAYGSVRLGPGQALLHDCYMLDLTKEAKPSETVAQNNDDQEEPGSGQSTTSTTTPPSSSSTTTQTTVDLDPWAQRKQKRVCLIESMTSGNHNCDRIIELTVSQQTTKQFNKVPTLPGRLYVLVETASTFEWVELSKVTDSTQASQGGGYNWEFLNKESSLARDIEALKKAGKRMIKKMVGLAENFGDLVAARLTEVRACKSPIIQLLAGTKLGLAPNDVTDEEVIRLEAECVVLNRYSSVDSRTSRERRSITNFLLWDHSSLLESLRVNSNNLALNQQALHAALQSLRSSYSRSLAAISTSVKTLGRRIRLNSEKIFYTTAASEIKNYLMHNNIARVNLGNKISQAYSALMLAAGRYDNEINDLSTAMRGQDSCRFTTDFSVACDEDNKSGVMAALTTDGRFSLLLQARVYETSEYLWIRCLPVRGKVSQLSKRVWRSQNDRLTRGNLSFPLGCLYSTSNRECGSIMTDLDESHLTGKLFRSANVRYLIDDGRIVAVESDGYEVVVKTRGGGTITIGAEPVEIPQTSFPLALAGEKVRLRHVLKEADLSVEEYVVLEGFSLKEYTLQTAPATEEDEEDVRLKITELAGIADLIKVNPTFQVISGLGVTILVLGTIITICCCVRNQSCRACLRLTCCAACHLSDVKTKVKDRINREKVAYQSWSGTRRTYGKKDQGGEVPGKEMMPLSPGASAPEEEREVESLPVRGHVRRDAHDWGGEELSTERL